MDWQEDRIRRLRHPGTLPQPAFLLYSPEAFRDRVYSAVLEGAAASVAAFSNLGEVISHYPDQRVYCFFMFSIEKEPCS